MSFKKLALVTAMFAATSGAFAMEAMDEESMAATTGQDGLTIGINTQATLDVIIHDKGGFTGATSDGAIYLNDVGISDGAAGDAQLRINIDAGHDGVNNAALNINVASLNNIVVDLGEVSAAVSTGYAAGTTAQGTTIVDLGTVSIGAGTLMNIQLGHEYQGNLIDINTTLTGGITINNFALNDISGTLTGGAIHVGTVSVNDAGAGANLAVDLGIDATVDGLAITVTQLGVAGTGAGTGIDLSLANVRLGEATDAAIGDVEIRGLNMNGDTIYISGH